ESGSVGEDVRLGLGDRFELKRSVALAAYSRVIDKLLLGVRTGGAIADGELAGTLADLQVVDLRRVGAPVFVANEKGDGANHLGPTEADIAQRAVLELNRQGPGLEHPVWGTDFFRAAKLDGARCLPRHPVLSVR